MPCLLCFPRRLLFLLCYPMLRRAFRYNVDSALKRLPWVGSSSISPFALFFGGAMMPTSQKRKHSNAGLPNNLLQAVGHVAVLWGQIEYIIDRPLSPWSGIGLSQNQTVLESAKLDDFSPGNGIFLQSIVLRRFSIVWEK
jgi:hypothetical protein